MTTDLEESLLLAVWLLGTASEPESRALAYSALAEARVLGYKWVGRFLVDHTEDPPSIRESGDER